MKTGVCSVISWLLLGSGLGKRFAPCSVLEKLPVLFWGLARIQLRYEGLPSPAAPSCVGLCSLETDAT